MTRTLRPGFDHHVLGAPFGVMFRDSLDRRVVSDGLQVELSDARLPGKAQRLTANGHGVFVAHAVRRLRAPAEDGGASPPATRRFSLSVADSLGRFVPLRLEADLPVDGLFQPSCLNASPSDAEPHVPLFSAATRTLPAGRGVLRADLRLASNPDAGAAWARLELWLGGSLLAEGVADGRGAALLLCPLPMLHDPPLRGSPPVAQAETPSWEVTLRAYWDAGLAGLDVPDLCALLHLPEVTLLERVSPARRLGSLVLQAGMPLIVRSAGSSFLFVGS